MSIALENKTDFATREAVERELRWAPQIREAAGIGVAVHDGVVSLTGEVGSFAELTAAGRIALRTRGVTSIANDLSVRHATATPTDAELAENVRNVLRLNTNVPSDAVEAEVSNHIVTLSGSVDWNYQRRAACQAVEVLRGVRAVRDLITLRPRANLADAAHAHQEIQAAFVRNANLDAGRVRVQVQGSTATLTGTVSSYAERKAAEHAAWSSPHIASVVNKLRVVVP